MHLQLHKDMSNQEIAALLSFISGILSFDEKNVFRTKAYDEAAQSISQYDEELKDIFRKKQDAQEVFDQIPGVGESITAKLIELFTTGDIKTFQKYVRDFPEGMYILCQVAGIGPKTAYKLAKTFPLTEKNAIEQIMKKAEQGKIRTLEDFGEKSEEELFISLRDFKSGGRIPYPRAKKIADFVSGKIKNSFPQEVQKIVTLGSLRRQRRTIGDIDLGAAVKDPSFFEELIKKLAIVKKVVVAGDGLIRLNLKANPEIGIPENFQVDIKISPLDEWGSFLQHFTGSKEHNIKLRKYALSLGFSLSEHGIKILKTEQTSQTKQRGQVGQTKKFTAEKEFYNFLGLKFIPPEKREGGEEIEQAKLT